MKNDDALIRLVAFTILIGKEVDVAPLYIYEKAKDFRIPLDDIHKEFKHAGNVLHLLDGTKLRLLINWIDRWETHLELSETMKSDIEQIKRMIPDK